MGSMWFRGLGDQHLEPQGKLVWGSYSLDWDRKYSCVFRRIFGCRLKAGVWDFGGGHESYSISISKTQGDINCYDLTCSDLCMWREDVRFGVQGFEKHSPLDSSPWHFTSRSSMPTRSTLGLFEGSWAVLSRFLRRITAVIL